MGQNRTVLEAAFLRTMFGVLVVAGVVGALAAAGVATFLALQITAPASELTRAPNGRRRTGPSRRRAIERRVGPGGYGFQ